MFLATIPLFLKKDQRLMEKMVSKLEISPVQISLRNTLVKHDWYKCKEDATNTQYEDVEVPALTNLTFRISIKLEISVK